MQHLVRGAIAATITFATFVFAIFSTQGLAQEASVVVTATRTPTRASALLNDVSVIGRSQIVQAGQSTLAELLQTQPGVQILSQGGGPGSASAISIRGASAQQTLVLIDGQRLSSATVGSTALEHIPLDQIERIEIVRGPASALYGADAIGGVVQIFTRQGRGAPHPYGEAGIGSYRTAAGSLGYGGRAGDTTFNLTYGYGTTGSFSATRPGAFGFNPDRDPYTNQSLSAHLARRLGQAHEIGARLFVTRGRTHFDSSNCDAAFVVCSNDFDNVQDQSLGSYAVYLRNRFSANWLSELRAGESRDELSSRFLDPTTNVLSAQRFSTTQRQFSWQNDIGLSSGKLMLAAERRRETVDSNMVSFTVPERSTDSLVAGFQASLGAHSVQLSGRHDRITNFSGSNSGSAAYGYQLAPAWRVFASIGSAYRVPTFADLYWPVDFATFYVGNPDLRPERSRNRELGVAHDTASQRISLTAYDNRVRDLIGFGAASAPAFFTTTVNVGRAALRGATGRYDGDFGNWHASASYDVLHARDEDSGRFLIRRAKNSGTAALRYRGAAWQAGLEMVAAGPRWVDAANTQRTGGFTLFNVDAQYALAPRWTLFARANNVFAKRYELVQGFATPGANLFAGVRYAGD